MTFETEFPDYPAADMPAMPAGFTDQSWKQDAMPRFDCEALELTVWVDYLDPAKREHAGPRFLLVDLDEDGMCEDEVARSEDWNDILAAIAERRMLKQLLRAGGYHIIEDGNAPRVGLMFHVMHGNTRIGIRYSRLEAVELMHDHAKKGDSK